LTVVDPLDEAKVGQGCGKADREFYRGLLAKFPRPERSRVAGE